MHANTPDTVPEAIRPKLYNALRCLDLSHCDIGDEDGAIIANMLPNAPTLLVLDLSSNRIHDEGFLLLARTITGDESRLEMVSFADNFITKSALKSLVLGFRRHRQIWATYVRKRNSVGGVHYPEVIVKVNERMCVVDIRQNDITTEGLGEIVHILASGAQSTISAEVFESLENRANALQRLYCPGRVPEAFSAVDRRTAISKLQPSPSDHIVLPESHQRPEKSPEKDQGDGNQKLGWQRQGQPPDARSRSRRPRSQSPSKVPIREPSPTLSRMQKPAKSPFLSTMTTRRRKMKRASSMTSNFGPIREKPGARSRRAGGTSRFASTVAATQGITHRAEVALSKSKSGKRRTKSSMNDGGVVVLPATKAKGKQRRAASSRR